MLACETMVLSQIDILIEVKYDYENVSSAVWNTEEKYLVKLPQDFVWIFDLVIYLKMGNG